MSSTGTVPAPWNASAVASGIADAVSAHGQLPPGLTDEQHITFEDREQAAHDNVQGLARAFSRTHPELARTISRASSQHTRVGDEGAPLNPFVGTDDPELDPSSGKFNARSWARQLLALESRDPDAYPKRTAGVSFKNLNVYGYGSATDFQPNVGNMWLKVFASVRSMLGLGRQQKLDILRDFDGLVKSGEMLVVLGRPGSGCSTLLKTIAGETYGLYVENPNESLQYQGISFETMHKDFRGEAIYQAETDVHFPQLTVGETLAFAAEARAPHNRLPHVSRTQFALHARDVMMAIMGLSHTLNTRVGNEYIRGVSGGERKRVSIAEAALSRSPLQCWDNSTRGLDSATAVEFVRTLRLGTEVANSTALVAIYQSPQSAYDLFDKVTVLYEGRQIYFGSTRSARAFFEDMGFVCVERQTTPDFLTSLSNPAERVVRAGWETRVPRTADEFAARWRASAERAALLTSISEYQAAFPVGGAALARFAASRRAEQARHMRARSPYTITVPMQVRLCIRRGYQRTKGDLSNTITMIGGNIAIALIIASVFFNLPENTGSFFSRNALIFFAILSNAFQSALEILTLYQQRPIVEKHTKYALYHPFAEAIASVLCELPSKIIIAIGFNLVIYFMANLRREVGAFFIFFLFAFTCTLVMSFIFRTIGAMSRTLSQAMAPAALFILALVIYTGFTVPIRNMHPWFRWINYLDPIAYAFEALMINEYSHRHIPCSTFVPAGPSYANITGLQQACSVVGSVPGQSFVDGDRYINESFQYFHSHLWRNFGILIVFFLFFAATYLYATETISAQPSKGEVLVFPRGRLPQKRAEDEEAGPNEKAGDSAVSSSTSLAGIHRQTDIFFWKDVCYDIKIKGQPRRLLDHVDGWVKPGTLTALMGVSGAGKTTLLDVLASRVTMGVISGDMLVNGYQRDQSFQRKTGYVQQQDLHLSTSTVREALRFSAILRQPSSTPHAEKLAYVEEVIKLLEMEPFAEAVVGVPGEGLNVEQRKRLTIGVELVAKPQLLLFFDEPTSGLDSQTSWSICALMRKLANNGQAILCTIHQPSAILLQQFDRLLFLARGGRTVYFGPMGHNASELIAYFERNGAHQCKAEENPAEWMLDVIGAAPGSHSEVDWPDVWNKSPERAAVREEIDHMRYELAREKPPAQQDPAALKEFAMPFWVQFRLVFIRICQQYWRTPSYIYSKFALAVCSAAFIGFSFWMAGTSQQGLQNQLFAVFMLMTIFGNLAQQIMPNFVMQRSLYEVRERPAKSYSWQSFIIANIIVEMMWQTALAVLTFVAWYYPIGMYKNAMLTGELHSRSALMFLLVWLFYMFTSTFTMMVIAGIESAELGGNLSQLMFTLSLVFCGVLAGPSVFPRFWIFMYRVSPFTYLVSAMLSTGLAHAPVHCSSIEFITFNPPAGQTCGQYMQPYISMAGGYLRDAGATSDCRFCTIASTDVFLASINADFGDRWRNVGLLFVYCVFNAAAALALYWLLRVPKGKRTKEVQAGEQVSEAK